MVRGWFLIALALGCGARTGLDAPDVGARADVCVELPRGSLGESYALEHVVRIATADVLFLVDVTGSMGGEVSQIRSGLRTRLAPALLETIPGAEIGVASFADFPLAPHGAPRDAPFVLLQAPTAQLGRVEDAVLSLRATGGNDTPESHVEALFQLATGNGVRGFVPAAACAPGRVGGGCFREDATPIVLLITDAMFHNGPGGAERYEHPDVVGVAATYADAVAALDALGARVLGLFSGTAVGARADLERIARDTGAVGEDGAPLVSDIGLDGRDLDEGVAEVVRRLVDEGRFDVSLELEDASDDAGDALALVRDVVAAPPTPAAGASVLGDAYAGVVPGTRLRFVLSLSAEDLPPSPGPRRYRLVATVRGDGVLPLERRVIDLVVPGAEGAGCPP